jgi:hypothetical protein
MSVHNNHGPTMNGASFTSTSVAENPISPFSKGQLKKTFVQIKLLSLSTIYHVPNFSLSATVNEMSP